MINFYRYMTVSKCRVLWVQLIYWIGAGATPGQTGDGETWQTGVAAGLTCWWWTRAIVAAGGGVGREAWESSASREDVSTTGQGERRRRKIRSRGRVATSKKKISLNLGP